MHQKLKDLTDFTVGGVDISPVKHVRLSVDNSLERLEKIVDYAQTKQVSLTVARYLKDEKFPAKPSIRISVNVDLTEEEIDLVVNTLKRAATHLV